MRRFGEYLLVRLVWVLGLLSLAAWCGGCRCGTQSYDQVFLLNASADAALISTDGGDASASNVTASLDCTPAAAGCVVGGPCAAAGHCVLDRDLRPSGSIGITRCTLLADPAPAVEVHYTITFSGCGD
jgi:hypothetical protein